jgi:hypothetical protein
MKQFIDIAISLRPIVREETKPEGHLVTFQAKQGTALNAYLSGSEIHISILVDEAAPLVNYAFRIIGHGVALPNIDTFSYIDTVIVPVADAGTVPFHVLQVPWIPPPAPATPPTPQQLALPVTQQMAQSLTTPVES